MRQVGILLLAAAWLIPSAAWCFCPPEPASAAHGCCDEGPGLQAGMRHCCQGAEAKARRGDLVPAGAVPAGPAAVLADRWPAPGLVPRPAARSCRLPPAVVLRI